MNTEDDGVLTGSDLWSLAALGLAAVLSFSYVAQNWLDTPPPGIPAEAATLPAIAERPKQTTAFH